jgi:hypothetical protein
MFRPCVLTAVLVATALAASGCKTDYEGQFRKMVATFDRIADTLEGVKDKSSALAAAPQVRAQVAELKELKAKVDAMNVPPADEQKRLGDTVKPEMAKAAARVKAQCDRIRASSASSPELDAALQDLVKLLRG